MLEGRNNDGTSLARDAISYLLAVLGAACSVNAARCHRVHCYVTGPFFLIMAAVTLLYGSGVLQLGTRGWSAISLVVVIGAAVLCWVPEKIVGQYRSPR